MDSFQLYSTWYRELTQSFANERVSRIKNMAWLIVGLYQAASVHLSAIVRQWPMQAKNVSLTRRLTRFLDNPAVAVRAWYAPVARRVLKRCVGEQLRLIIDGSKVGFGHQLLMVALAHRRRALPLAWTWVKGQRGHSSAAKQLALLSYVRQLLPSGARVVLIGDAEFGSVAVIKQVRRWRWGYVLRQKSNHQVRCKGSRRWQPFAQLVAHPGQSQWWAEAFLTRQWKYPTALLAYWAPNEDDPWLLATNLPDAYHARQAYARRMWIEEMFGDWKGHGFDLESTHLRHFQRLSRLTLAVALLYVWLLRVGQRAIRRGLRHWVDRHDRRDLSLFRIGWSLIDKWLALHQNIPVAFRPLLSGG